MDYLFASKTNCRQFQQVTKERRESGGALEVEVNGTALKAEVATMKTAKNTTIHQIENVVEKLDV